MGSIRDSDHLEMTDTLRNFFVTSIGDMREDSLYPFCAKDLLDEEKRMLILHEQAIQQGLKLRGKGAIAVGTLFAKRYSVFVMAVISAFSLYDARLSIVDETVRFELNGSGGMRYKTLLESASLQGSEDPDLRRIDAEILKDGLKQHLDQLFQSVAEVTGASPKVMWSLVAHNVQQLYIRLMRGQWGWLTERRLNRIEQDRDLWLESSETNPFAIQLQPFEHSKWKGPLLYIRRYCCLAYQVGDGDHSHGYCNSCPKLTPDMRLNNLLQQ